MSDQHDSIRRNEDSPAPAEMLDLRQLWLRRDTGAPAKDCWLLIPSGGLSVTPEIQKAWLAMAKEFRRIRGDFLVAGFEIEFSVDGLISEVLFALPPDSGAEEQGVSNLMNYHTFSKLTFDRLFLKASENQFGRKIALLKKLSEQFPTLGALIPKDLIDRLRKIMDVRNIFAHYPIVFVLDPRLGESDIHALLIRDSKPIEINKGFLQKHAAAFSAVDRDLSQVLEQLRKEPLKEQPRGVGKLIPGRTFLGHSDLNVETWLGVF
jgi:hypothetical protein